VGHELPALEEDRHDALVGLHVLLALLEANAGEEAVELLVLEGVEAVEDLGGGERDRNPGSLRRKGRNRNRGARGGMVDAVQQGGAERDRRG